MHHGFIYRAPKKGDYHQNGTIKLGGLPLRPDGQWDDFLPPDDLQDKYLQTKACATFGTLHAVEILERQEFGDTTDWSRRFLAKESGTTANGNDPHTVAETLRKLGDVYESDLPYNSSITTWEEFYAPISGDLETQAVTKFKGKYNFAHQYVGTDRQSMINALIYSPLGADVYAWNLPDANGIYHRQGFPSEHWIVIYGSVLNEYWKCFDTYDLTRKKLAWDFGFTMVKQYTLHKQVLTDSLWSQAIRYFEQKLHLGDYAHNFGAERSPQWETVRKAFVLAHPDCAVCHSKKNLNVHHKLPFHLHPKLELNPANLITLCRDHHYLFGHLLNWSSFNADVETDTRIYSDKIIHRPT